MKRILFITFTLLLPLTSHAWEELEKGLEYQVINLNAADAKPLSDIPARNLHAFRIDPKKYSLRPLLASDHNPAYIKTLAEPAGAKLAINANFFDLDGHPLGLVIHQGKVVHPFKNISWWGVFAVEKSRVYIFHASQYQPNAAIVSAVQAGPRLVVNGMIPPKLKPQLSAKTALGINKKGEVIVVATRDLMTTEELATLFVRSEKEGGLGCVDALNLDGGSSTQLYAKVGMFTLQLDGYARVPVGLGVFQRSPLLR